MSEKKVKVKLAARCLVDGAIREAKDIVEIDEEIAAYFGEVQGVKPAAEPKEAKEKK